MSSFKSFPNILRLYVDALKGNKLVYLGRMIACAALLSVEVGVATLVPFAFKRMLTVSPDQYSLVFAFLLLANYAVLRFLKDILSNVSDVIFFPITNFAIRTLRLRVLMHVHSLNLARRRTLALSDIISAMRRVSHSTRIFFRVCVLQIIPTIAKIAVVTIILFQYGFTLIPFVLGLLLITWVLMAALPKYQEVRRTAWGASDKFVKRVTDGLLQDEQTRTNYTFERRRLEKQADIEASVWYQTNTMCNVLQVQLSLAKLVLFVGVLGAGVYMVLDGTLPQGDLVILHGQMLAVLIPLGSLMREIRQLIEAITDLEQVNGVLQIESDPPHAIQSTYESKAIEVEGLCFGYKKKLILRNLHAKISFGDSVLLKGQNGSGKSTFMNLMSGILKPIQGKVLYHKSTRVLYIPQDTTLYNDSLLFNVTLDEDSFSMKRVIHVLEEVGLGDLAANEKNLFANIGDLGMTLSGGQRSRVWIARALYYKPNVLFMDETLDSVDRFSRESIFKLLQKHVGTIVIASHHDDVANYTDQMIDLDENLAQRVIQASHTSRINAVN